MKWEYTYKGFEEVRDLISSYEEDDGDAELMTNILKGIVKSCEDIRLLITNENLFYEDYIELENDISDCLENDLEILDDEMVDHFLCELYDLCDVARVFLDF